MMTEAQAQELKPLLKELLRELLTQERDLLAELVYEVMEEIALARAIDEGKNTEKVKRDDIFTIVAPTTM